MQSHMIYNVMGIIVKNKTTLIRWIFFLRAEILHQMRTC